MSLSLQQAMREILAGWSGDLGLSWRAVVADVEPSYDGIDPELTLAPWEPVFPARRGRVYPGAPKGAHVFRAFDDIAPEDVRVVILGQDPYPCAAFATGRAFEAGNVARWRELEKMFSKSVRTWMQLVAAARTGDAGYAGSVADWDRLIVDIEAGGIDLEPAAVIAGRWVRQGVLLLDSSLTLSRFAVEGDPHQVRGHLPLWRPVVVAVLRYLKARGTPVVFMGFGSQAAEALAEAGITEDAASPTVVCILREHPARAEAVLALENPLCRLQPRACRDERRAGVVVAPMASADTYDYIVIGAGSAGCVLANRLSADPSRSVLLLEAGGKDRHPLVRLPLLMGKLMHSKIYNWSYDTEPEPELDNRRIYWPRGKALGGTSTINGMIYVRGNASDYDRWAQMGNLGWSYAEVLPFFRKSENHAERRDDFHGEDGPLSVCRARGRSPLFDRFVEAGVQAGHARNDDFNGAGQDGFGRYDFTIRKGKRCSTSRAFLRPAMRRPNLTVVTHALTTRIVVEGGRAVAVDYARGDAHHRAYAAREVVLSAGAVNSPQTLMLSGIGDADELKAHGIGVVRHLPGVGKNLQDHVDVCLVYEVTEPVTLYGDLRVDRLTMAIIQGALFGTGVATTFPYEGGAFLRSRPGLVAPDIQAHFMPALEKTANLHWPKFGSAARVGDNHGVTIRVGPVNPESRGRLTLRSADPRDPPKIFANYLWTPFDKETTIAGVKLLREVMRQPAFADIIGPEVAPGPDKANDAALIAWLKQAGGTTLHPVGTCKMGSGDDAVVDHELRVHGVAGLRVADASIMPIISSGNTNAPTIMIGEKAADMILRASG